jgi:hypothetical protein
MASISNMMSGGSAGKQQRPMPQKPMAGEDSGHSELHPHGDGTYHTMTGGRQTEHPHLGHALAHMAKHHEAEGSHSIVHHHAEGHTAHHAKEGGEVMGPEEHPDTEGVKQGMDKMLGGGEGEGGNDQHDHEGSSSSEGLF